MYKKRITIPLLALLLLGCSVKNNVSKLLVEQFNHINFKSTTLNDKWDYSIYLPKSYHQNSTKRYPVIYFLHGMADNNVGVASQPIAPILNEAIDKGQIGEVIMIIPNSRGSSWWVDSKAFGKMATAFNNDLITYIDTTYRTIAKKENRVIMGLSMGGFGALKQAITNAEKFYSVIILSPAMYSMDPRKELKHPRSYTPSFLYEMVGNSLLKKGAFGEPFDEANLIENSYPALFKNYKNEGLNKLNFALYYGNKDNVTDNPTQHFIDFMKKQEPSMPVHSLDGGHVWGVWLYAISHLLNTRPDFIAYQ